MVIHSDEARSADLLLKQRAAELLSDPENLVRKYEGLAAREKRLHKTIAKLESETKKLQSKVKENGATAAKQTELLGSARAALDAYRDENQRLKNDLQRVRGSHSMRVGRAVLSPMHSVKSLMRQSEPEKATSDSQAPNAGSPNGRTAADAQPTSSDSIRSAPTKKKQGRNSAESVAQPAAEASVTEAQIPHATRLEQLEENFSNTRDADNLATLISHQWYGRGMVIEPARLLREHQDLRAQFDKKSEVLASRILGAVAVERISELIPVRSDGPAYTVERSRVMYCAHSTPMFNSNGYSTRTKGIVHGLSQIGVDVSVVARVGYPWDSEADSSKPKKTRHVATLDGVQYVHLPGSNLNTSPLDRYIIDGADALVREAKLQRPSLIHAASNFRNALPALIAARRLGLPFVYEVRGLWEVTEASRKTDWDLTERYRLMADSETLVATEADLILAITQEIADELVRRGVPKSRIRLAPNSVDASAFLPLPSDDSYAAKLKIRTDVPVIGFAGSIVDYEGLDTLLDATEILNAQGTQFQVVIAGSGSYSNELRRIRDSRKIRNVTFTGRLPIAEMPRIYSLFDIMPCPRHSLPVTEMVSPLKPLEAFASSKSVVLSDVSPHRALSGADGERALLFPAGDAEALAAALTRLIEDRELREEMGRRSRRWVRTNRSWNDLGERISNWYAEARVENQRLIAGLTHRLSDLTIGVIADEFTSKTLSGSVNGVPIDRSTWRQQLEATNFDAVFIESAWEGNGGQWHRGVGYYGEEENRDLFQLVVRCEALGIPTIFWNKEDPVHFNRFRLTAARCTHVFTTDADMVVNYLSPEWSKTKVAASLPFYAQPTIHNPLPGGLLYDESAAYAGTYYGDRYPERSKTLSALLEAARPHRLSIYDRQLSVPGSQYHFPKKFSADVRGVLAYDKVIDSYKSHLAQLNVNSVENSPSMYSRRVVEIPACGGLVLSGPGRGISETFGTAIPATSDARNWRSLLHSWSTDPTARAAESWLQYRSVMRSHTVDTELTIMFRIAGIPVAGPRAESYSLQVVFENDEEVDEVVESLARQSILPETVYVSESIDEVRTQLEPFGITVEAATRISEASSEWMGVFTHAVTRTHFEDLLLACRFGKWTRISVRQASIADRGSTIARELKKTESAEGLMRTAVLKLDRPLVQQFATTEGPIIEWIVPELRASVKTERSAIEPPATVPKTVVVAGHDLKFARHIIDELQRSGHRVLIDQWESHTAHDEDRSKELLDQADVVFCEWGLGNAVWYSKHKRPHQRLVVRVHSQELRRQYLKEITTINVNAFVFVGELVRQAAIHSHGIPELKATVIPNFVDTAGLNRAKKPGAEKNLGLVGIIPQSKRLDRALDILEQLLAVDREYRLFIKGKGSDDYPWLKNRPEELAYYEEQNRRIDLINDRHPGAVILDGYSPDMNDWYTKIGIALSVSDFESFHFTIPDGAASGAAPYSLAWPGSDLLYPDRWIYDSTEAMAEAIRSNSAGPSTENQAFVAEYYNGLDSAIRLSAAIVGDMQ